MKRTTRIKSKLAVAFSSYFLKAYNHFTLKHVNQHEDCPETTLTKPLSECNVALLTTAGVHLKSDTPFNVDNPAGDHTIRIIPSNTEEEDLTVTHIYYDTKSAKIDPSIVFPLKQLNSLAEEGVIGSVADANIGLNGGILNTALVEAESIPKVIERLKMENVDAALLVPG